MQTIINFHFFFNYRGFLKRRPEIHLSGKTMPSVSQSVNTGMNQALMNLKIIPKCENVLFLSEFYPFVKYFRQFGENKVQKIIICGRKGEMYLRYNMKNVCTMIKKTLGLRKHTKEHLSVK